jgi:hypothetical protein
VRYNNNGYQILPNGIVLQWGIVNNGNLDTAKSKFTYPMKLSQVYNVQATAYRTQSGTLPYIVNIIEATNEYCITQQTNYDGSDHGNTKDEIYYFVVGRL